MAQHTEVPSATPCIAGRAACNPFIGARIIIHNVNIVSPAQARQYDEAGIGAWRTGDVDGALVLVERERLRPLQAVQEAKALLKALGLAVEGRREGPQLAPR